MVNECYFMVLGLTHGQTTLKWNKLTVDITAHLSLFICTYDFGICCTSWAPLVTSSILTQSFSLFYWAPLFDSTGQKFETLADPAPLDLYELVTSISVPPPWLLVLQSVSSSFSFLPQDLWLSHPWFLCPSFSARRLRSCPRVGRFCFLMCLFLLLNPWVPSPT